MISNRDTKAEVAARLSPFLDEWGAIAGGWVPANYGQVRDQLNLIASFNGLPTIAPGEMGGDARAKINALLALENYRKLDLNFGTNWGYLIGPGGRSGPVANLLSVLRASGATYFDASGILRTAGNNVLRLDHDPVTKEPRGALIEGAATNLFTISTNVDPSGVAGASVSLNQGPGPTGANTLAKLSSTVSTGSNTAYVNSIFTVANDTTVRTYSVHLRQGSTPVTVLNFYYVGGTIVQAVGTIDWTTKSISFSGGSGRIEHLGGGLYRAQVALGNNGSGNTTAVCRVYARDRGATHVVGEYVYCGDQQLEVGAFATSYIITTAGAATRAADVVSIPTSAFPFNPNEGTIYAEWSSKVLVEGPVANLDAGSKNAPPYLRMGVSSLTGGRVLAEYAPGQTLDFNEGAATDIAQPVKAAFAYIGVDHAISTHGRAAKAGIGPVAASGFTRLLIGDAAWFTAPNSHIKRLIYMPRWLSNAELQAMTS